jgi:hypothetical protein
LLKEFYSFGVVVEILFEYLEDFGRTLFLGFIDFAKATFVTEEAHHPIAPC